MILKKNQDKQQGREQEHKQNQEGLEQQQQS